MLSLIFVLYFTNMFLISRCTIDLNLSELQYLADHLTKAECHELVAALHFKDFELPKELNAAERRLPNDVSCIDLLLHWNSTPKEGKGKTHIEMTHRLSQIGRPDLAEWLSKTVFHEISMDLLMAMLISEEESTTFSTISNSTEIYPDEEKVPEERWGEVDTVVLTLILIGLFCLALGTLFFCCLCCLRRIRYSGHGYKQLSLEEGN